MTAEAKSQAAIESRIKDSMQRMHDTTEFCQKFVDMFTTAKSASFTEHDLKMGLAKTLNAIEKLMKKEKKEYLKLRNDMKELGYDVAGTDHQWAETESLLKEVKKYSKKYFAGKISIK